MVLENQIRKALECFTPIHVEIVNESDSHRGPPGRETHFKLLLVSTQFQGKSRLIRQQMIYQALDFAFKQGLHALSLKTLSPEEWSENTTFTSPACSHKK